MINNYEYRAIIIIIIIIIIIQVCWTRNYAKESKLFE